MIQLAAQEQKGLGDSAIGDDQPVVQKHFRIPVERLRLGMFVADLDRPWIDTPFLIQGFVVESVDELKALQQYCRHVYVDLYLSLSEVAQAIREAEHLGSETVDVTTKGQFQSLRSNTSTVSGSDDGAKRFASSDTQPEGTRTTEPKKALSGSGRFRVKLDKPPPAKSQQRFREFVKASNGDGARQRQSSGLSGLWARITDMFSPSSRARIKNAREIDKGKLDLQREFRKTLPPGTKLVKYDTRIDLREELPRAREKLQTSEATLKQVLGDIRNGSIPNVEIVKEAVDDMVESMVSNPDALMWLARMRDEDTTTYSHGVRVSLYMVLLGRQLGFPKEQLSQLGMIGMLADVGKLEIPRTLLQKPGMLTDAEHDQIKHHVEIGLRAIKAGGPLAPEVELGIAQHHERLDGTGYPHGLRGDQISIFGRIAGIADCFAALITSRPYANAQAPQDALLNLYHWAGTSFHEAMVEQFVQAVGVFPVGSMIELSTGEVAVVIAQNRVKRLEPRVLLLTWPDKRPLATPVEQDLFKKSSGADGRRVRIARGLPSGAFGLKMRDYYADNIINANKLV